MSNIQPSNTTTQLLIKDVGVEDQYHSFLLPANEVVMDDPFFENASVNDVVPKIFTVSCPNMSPDSSQICTWVIATDLGNNITITEDSTVLSIKDELGQAVIAANSLIAYDSTYSLNIYIRSNGVITAGKYSAVIQL